MSRLRVGLVVQRYGLEVNGGAELHCRMIAERLAPLYEVEVLTTCAVDYVTWKNEYAPGDSQVNGVPVRRFRVEHPRDIAKFNEYSAWILSHTHTLADERRWVEMQGPHASGLFSYLRSNANRYDAFIFFTYLYASTCIGLPLVANRALLVPTAHDEWPIYFAVYDQVFRSARRLLLSTPEERDFVFRRFCLEPDKCEIVGVGVEPFAVPDSDPAWAEIRAHTGDLPLITYVGRIDESKGCRELIDYFRQYLDERPGAKLKLLLLGKAAMPVPEHPAILPAGFVSDATRNSALSASRILVNPSPYESLSLAALEGWCAGKPLLANGRCEVLRGQCRRSNGGLWYTNYAEFCACLDLLLQNENLCARLGEQGRNYAMSNYSWERVLEQYSQAIAEITDVAPASRPMSLTFRLWSQKP